MKIATKEKLRKAQEWCDSEDKSTEFMLEYMQDAAGVNLDCVLNFLKGSKVAFIMSEKVVDGIKILPHCKHGNNLSDWSGARLEPDCGCNFDNTSEQNQKLMAILKMGPL